MQTLTVKASGYTLTEGFVYTILEKDEYGDTYYIQACLNERKFRNEEDRLRTAQANKNLYKKEINSRDNGMEWGLCDQVNAKSYIKFGKNACIQTFKRELKNLGIKIVK